MPGSIVVVVENYDMWAENEAWWRQMDEEAYNLIQEAFANGAEAPRLERREEAERATGTF